MAEYADAYPDSSLARGIADVKAGRVADLDTEGLVPLSISGTGFTLHYTGSLEAVIAQLNRRTLLA